MVLFPQVPASTPPVRVVVSSTWRSGSTLLGEVLAAHPGAYYHYEPLMPYGLQQLGPSTGIQVVILGVTSLGKSRGCVYSLLHSIISFAIFQKLSQDFY